MDRDLKQGDISREEFTEIMEFVETSGNMDLSNYKQNTLELFDMYDRGEELRIPQDHSNYPYKFITLSNFYNELVMGASMGDSIASTFASLGVSGVDLGGGDVIDTQTYQDSEPFWSELYQVIGQSLYGNNFDVEDFKNMV